MNSRINSKRHILTLKRTAYLILTLGFSMAGARANLFVSDYNHDVVDQFDSSGNFVNSSSIQQPTGVTIGPDGNLYAGTGSPADGNGAEINVFNPATGSKTGTGPSHVTDNSLNNPAGMAFGPNGNLYV